MKKFTLLECFTGLIFFILVWFCYENPDLFLTSGGVGSRFFEMAMGGGIGAAIGAGLGLKIGGIGIAMLGGAFAIPGIGVVCILGATVAALGIEVIRFAVPDPNSIVDIISPLYIYFIAFFGGMSLIWFGKSFGIISFYRELNNKVNKPNKKEGGKQMTTTTEELKSAASSANSKANVGERGHHKYLKIFMGTIFVVIALFLLIFFANSIGVIGGNTGFVIDCEIEYEDIGIPFVGDKWISFTGKGIRGKLNPKTGELEFRLFFKDDEIKYEGIAYKKEFRGSILKFEGNFISGTANLNSNEMRIRIDVSVWS